MNFGQNLRNQTAYSGNESYVQSWKRIAQNGGHSSFGFNVPNKITHVNRYGYIRTPDQYQMGANASAQSLNNSRSNKKKRHARLQVKRVELQPGLKNQRYGSRQQLEKFDLMVKKIENKFNVSDDTHLAKILDTGRDALVSERGPLPDPKQNNTQDSYTDQQKPQYQTYDITTDPNDPLHASRPHPDLTYIKDSLVQSSIHSEEDNP